MISKERCTQHNMCVLVVEMQVIGGFDGYYFQECDRASQTAAAGLLLMLRRFSPVL